MSERAKVTSLEAIAAFRAKLILYREKAGRILDEAGESTSRTRLWLEHDRRAHWQTRIRQRTRELEQRQQELFSARIAGLGGATLPHQAAVEKARQALRDAEDGMHRVRQWQRQFDQRIEPLAHQVGKFQHTLGHDLGRAVTRLAEVIETLSAYAEISSSASKFTPASPPQELEGSESGELPPLKPATTPS